MERKTLDIDIATPNQSDLSSFRRIVILGPPGAGKTTLARQLGLVLGLPAHHLDDYKFVGAGELRDDEEMRHVHNALIETPDWIIDGNQAPLLESRLRRADCAILLDFPLYSFFGGVAKRGIKRFLGDRRSLSKNVATDPNYRWRPSISVALNLILFRYSALSKMQAAVERAGIPSVVLRNRSEVRRFLEEAGAPAN